MVSIKMHSKSDGYRVFSRQEWLFFASLFLPFVLFPLSAMDDDITVIILAFFGAVVAYLGAVAIADSFMNERVRLLRTICVLTAMWYFGPLVFLSYSLDEQLTLSTADQIYGTALLIVMAMAPVWLLTSFEPLLPINRDEIEAAAGKILGAIAVFSVVQLLLMASGAWSYTTLYSVGSDVSSDRVIFMALQPVTAPLLPLCAAVAGAARRRRQSGRLLASSILCLVQLAWWLPVGRRLLMMQAILAALLFWSA